MVKVYTVAAFTSDKNGGNLAGVVPNSEGLTEKQMQKIATKMGYSETAFISKGDKFTSKPNNIDTQNLYPYNSNNASNQIDFSATSETSTAAESSDAAGFLNDKSDVSNKTVFSHAAGFSDIKDFFDIADFNVRFFMPSSEVDLCGHATIASFKLLFLKGFISKGTYTQQTLAGKLEVTITDDELVLMQQAKPKFLDIIQDSDIAKSLGLDEMDIDAALPVQMVSTGLSDIIIPVTSIDVLKNIKPDFELISSVSKRYGSVGYHVFSTQARTGADASCRNFAPLYDIDEESATGTANGALCSYMFRYNVLKDNDYSKVVFEQGHFMDSPSEIVASLKINNGKIEDVLIGGNAVIISEEEIEV